MGKETWSICYDKHFKYEHFTSKIIRTYSHLVCPSWFPVFSTVLSLFCRHCYSCSPYTESHNVWRLHEFIVCVFSKSELRTPWLYPLCSDWLFQACSVCETAHVKSRAPIDRVEEDYGIYGTVLKVTHPFNHPPPNSLRGLYFSYIS